MNGMKPTRKVTGGVVGAALATITVWIVQITTGIDAPVGIEGALATVFGFAVAWFVKDVA